MTVTFTAIQKLLRWVSVGGGAGSKTSFAELSLDGNFRTWALLVLCHFFHSLKLNIAMKPLKEEETYVAEADYQSSMTLYTEM